MSDSMRVWVQADRWPDGQIHLTETDGVISPEVDVLDPRQLPDHVVEAGARAAALRHGWTAQDWDDGRRMDKHIRQMWRDDARACLEAALMAAQGAK